MGGANPRARAASEGKSPIRGSARLQLSPSACAVFRRIFDLPANLAGIVHVVQGRGLLFGLRPGKTGLGGRKDARVGEAQGIAPAMRRSVEDPRKRIQ